MVCLRTKKSLDETRVAERQQASHQSFRHKHNILVSYLLYYKWSSFHVKHILFYINPWLCPYAMCLLWKRPGKWKPVAVTWDVGSCQYTGGNLHVYSLSLFTKVTSAWLVLIPREVELGLCLLLLGAKIDKEHHTWSNLDPVHTTVSALIPHRTWRILGFTIVRTSGLCM